MHKKLDNTEFDSILENRKTAIVYCYADFAEISVSFIEELKNIPMFLCNIEENSDIAAALDVRAVPFISLIKLGNPIAFKVGLTTEDVVIDWLDSYSINIGELKCIRS